MQSYISVYFNLYVLNSRLYSELNVASIAEFNLLLISSPQYILYNFNLF
jgi:hypothetical protein